MMFVINGESISKGIAFGKIVFYGKNKQSIEKSPIHNVDEEIERFTDAREIAIGQLQVIYEKSVTNMGQDNASVFGVHQMLIEDVEFVDSVCHMIRSEQVNAEYAVATVSKQQEERLRSQKRAEDMRDVSERLLKILTGYETFDFEEQEGVILVAEDLLPSEMMRLDARKLAGILLLQGNMNSHVAIFARAMEIPMVIQMSSEWDVTYIGKNAVIDGAGSKVYVEPDEETTQQLIEKQQMEQRVKERQKEYQNRKTKVYVCANVGSIEEAELALQNGADGIGLVRSEAFCLKAGKMLGEEEQFEIYKQLVQIMDGKPVVIRTWDFGEDKQLKQCPAEESRGIRWCLENKDLFRNQLRAICRTSAYGPVAIMFPMISSVGELKEAKQLLNEVKEDLKHKNISYDIRMEVGVMLETPAAIMISRELAKQVDFCSIGTNDLIQYTFGLNRQKTIAREFYEECYPTLVQMLRTAISNVHSEGKKVGICGELGADLSWTETFVDMGMDSLSMAPNSILSVREKVIKTE